MPRSEAEDTGATTWRGRNDGACDGEVRSGHAEFEMPVRPPGRARSGHQRPEPGLWGEATHSEPCDMKPRVGAGLWGRRNHCHQLLPPLENCTPLFLPGASTVPPLPPAATDTGPGHVTCFGNQSVAGSTEPRSEPLREAPCVSLMTGPRRLTDSWHRPEPRRATSRKTAAVVVVGPSVGRVAAQHPCSQSRLKPQERRGPPSGQWGGGRGVLQARA